MVFLNSITGKSTSSLDKYAGIAKSAVMVVISMVSSNKAQLCQSYDYILKLSHPILQHGCLQGAFLGMRPITYRYIYVFLGGHNAL